MKNNDTLLLSNFSGMPSHGAYLSHQIKPVPHITAELGKVLNKGEYATAVADKKSGRSEKRSAFFRPLQETSSSFFQCFSE